MRLKLNPLAPNGFTVVQDHTTVVAGGTSSSTSSGATSLSELTDVDASVATPSDGDIIVYRDAGSDWVLEAKPAGGSNPALNDVTDVTITTVADNEVLAYDNGTATWINQTASEAGLATSAQGALADSATQPGDNISTLTNDSGFITDITGGNLSDLADTTITTIASGEILKWNGTAWVNNTLAEAGISAVGHTHTASNITDFDTEVSNNTDVAANTAARHAAVTVLDSSEIDFTLTGQQITASIVAGSIDETKLDTSTNASLDLADSSVQPGDNISTLTNDSGFTTNTGDVTAASSFGTDNVMVRSDGTGKGVQSTSISVSDTNNIILPAGASGTGGVVANELQSDTIAERNAAAGVTIDGVLIKDGAVDGRDVSVDGTKLDTVETNADVTDTANVTAAGALMDSEVTNLAQVKAFSSADYATAAQGALADSATQPGDNISTLTNDSGFTTNTGDVTAAASLTDNEIVRGDGGGKGVQDSTGVAIDDTGTLAFGIGSDGDITGVNTINGVSAATAQYTTAEETKLSGIETGADVTDTTNVTAAGALMDSEVDADLKTLSLPANTTISTFGASLIDDAAASNARTTLGLGTIATLAAPSGTVVGTTDTQTLTNKDLSSSTNTFGIGLMSSWSPSYTNLTVGNGTVLAEYTQIGDIVFYNFLLTVGSTTSVGDIRISLPVSIDTTTISNANNDIGSVYFADSSSGSDYQGIMRHEGSNLFRPVVLRRNSSNDNVSYTAMSSSSPFTWATGDTLCARGFYKAA